ncbi:MAG: L-threonylcarbamoyladenylate synthase [Dehalococcoidales bacterium]|nr:L-threonylcarbamoyladenylate synthase [Dehalococcoidales bacterium]
MSLEYSTDIKKQVSEGISILKSGGVVAFPTDTVYCLGARYDNIPALERIYEIKQRPHRLALPIIVSDVPQIEEVAGYIPPMAWEFINKYMPGAITLILPKSKKVCDIITNGKDTVAVRIPAHRLTIDIIKGVGVPIAGTSANTSGEPSNIVAKDVFAQIGDKADLIIDDGKCPGGIVSTIVDVTGVVPVIIREGAISRNELEEFYKGIK